MHNVLAVLRRDIVRIARVPSALIVAVGIIIIPALYAWFNTVGFWNPYGNTQGIKVAIVNEDSGAFSNSLGKLNLGRQIVDELNNNDQLGWYNTSHANALDAVRKGNTSAAIIIPQDFSATLVHLIETGEGERPTLQYIVNQKTNAIAAKITDTGADTVDRQINDTFVSTAGDVVAKTINTAADSVDTTTTQTKNNVTTKLNEAAQSIAQLRDTIARTEQQLEQVPTQTANARTALGRARLANTSGSDALARVSQSLTTTQQAVGDFATSSSSVLDTSSAMLSQASRNTNEAISSLNSALTGANQTLGSTLTQAQQLQAQTQQILEQLQTLPLPVTSTVAKDLAQANAKLGTAIEHISATNTDAGKTITSTTNTINALDSSTQQTLSAFGTARNTFNTSALQQLNTGFTTLAAASGNLAGSVQSRNSVINQANSVLDQLDDAAASATKALQSTDDTLADLNDQLSTLITDISAVSTARAVSDIVGNGGRLDTAKIADFMKSPTVLDTHTLFPVPTYGSGMAPLFINLSLWVGAFALVVIFKLEVDEEDLDGVLHGHLSSTQSYWARYLLLALLALAQGILTAVGELIIGVQTVNAPAFIATAGFTSLVYLAIIYSLSISFMHVGKGLCVALIMLQIPGSAGIYPIEMMPRFFRVMFPFFPFTHAVNAFRETIGGFYDGHWFKEMAILAIFAIVFIVFGLLVRPHLVNLNRLFAKELEHSEMVNMEPVMLRGHEVRLQQLIRALSNHDEFRTAIERRAERFALLYPKLKQAALITGIVVPLILAITLSFTPGAKVVVLVSWLVWFIIIIGALMALEMTKDSIERQVAVGNLSDEAVLAMMSPHMNNYLGNLIHEHGAHASTAQQANKQQMHNQQNLAGMHGMHTETRTETHINEAQQTDTQASAKVSTDTAITQQIQQTDQVKPEHMDTKEED